MELGTLGQTEASNIPDFSPLPQNGASCVLLSLPSLDKVWGVPSGALNALGLASPSQEVPLRMARARPALRG